MGDNEKGKGQPSSWRAPRPSVDQVQVVDIINPESLLTDEDPTPPLGGAVHDKKREG